MAASTKSTSPTDAAYVLYVDHQGHPAPLSLCYHATASRRLASAIDRHPPSTVTEVDSAYCPQCLSFHDATTAANIGYCPKSSCRLCPMCRSVASITVDGSDCLYKCGLCEWTSRDCNLITPVTIGENGIPAKDDLDKAAGELVNELNERQEQLDHVSQDHYKTMLSTLEGIAKEQVKGQRTNPFYSLFAASARRGNDGPKGWSIQSLEESINSRKELVAASIGEIVSGQELQCISLEAEQKLDESMEGKPCTSLLLQGGSVSTLSDLLPLPVPLRPRKSRRCRAELAEGRPGILVKPKLNPLEGDTSLRTGHGQWWKKDSSAIHVMPQVQVVRHASDGTKHAILLKVSNPTLGAISLQLQSSSYVGEPVWGSKTDEHNPNLDDLLVDVLSNTTIKAKLVTDTVQQLQASDMCQLEPAEDTFLELGKSYEEPDEVSKWDVTSVLASSTVTGYSSSPSTLRLVTQKSAAAWFELVVAEVAPAAGASGDEFTAMPLALKIKVGDGSWESSLIQPEPVREGELHDMVAFDIVIAWNSP